MSLSRANILLVDDEPSILATMSRILSDEGYEVDTAGDGHSAIRALQATHYDLVLTDLRMEGMDGLELLQHIRDESPQTVTVMITGYGSIDSAIEAVRLGAYEYLLKPVAVEEIKQAVRRSLDRKRLSELDSLYRLASELALSHTAEQVANAIEDTTRQTLGVATARWIALSRDGRLPLLDAAYRDRFTPDLLRRLAAGEVADFHGEQGKDSMVLVPGIAAGRLAAVLYVNAGERPFDFHASVKRYLLGLAAQGAVAQDNVLLLQALQKNNEELAESNRQLKELDKLKSQFLSVATHELRTPLSVVLGYNAMIEESAMERLTTEEKGLLRESLAACKRLIRLVNSMLDLSQIHTGKLQLQIAPADLKQSIASVMGLFGAEAHRRGVSLEMDIPEQMPKVEMDAERIEQVLVNLVANALKFTDTGSVKVYARVPEQGDSVEIDVCDTGIGIPKSHQKIIFDEFARVRDGRSAGRIGSGLGLAIARSFVRAHGGEILVESEPGQGSTFTVRLPIRHKIRNAMTA